MQHHSFFRNLPFIHLCADTVYLVTNKYSWFSLQDNVFNLSPVDLQGREVGEFISPVHNNILEVILIVTKQIV